MSHRRKLYVHRDFDAVTGWSLLQMNTPFIKPDLTRDLPNTMILTLALAESSLDPLVRNMFVHAQQYFAELHRQASALGRVPTELQVRQIDALCSFPERSELGFGYARFGHAGAGIGSGVLGATIRNALIRYAGLREALMMNPDCLQLIPQIGGDRVTDALGSIVLADLVRYTQSFAKYFDPACMKPHKWDNVYDGMSHRFGTTLNAEVPTDDRGRPILLVPKIIVRGSMALSASDYRHTVMVDGRPQQITLTKGELLEVIGFDPEAITHFAGPRLRSVRMHSRFRDRDAK